MNLLIFKKPLSFVFLGVISIILLLFMPQSALALSGSLVSESELNNQLDYSHTVIIDLSTPEVYSQGHIPGAINVQMSEFNNPNDPIPSMICTADQLEVVLGNLGIEVGDNIYIYSSNPIYATRLWWVLNYYGLNNIKILNGNFNTWESFRIPDIY